MKSNKKLSAAITGLFLRGRKLIVSLAFISQSFFKVPKSIHYFIIKIPNKRELPQVASNHSSDIS